jgi:hypothetical protein
MANKLVTIGHEVGHLLMNASRSDHNISSDRNLMNPTNHGPTQTEIRKHEWRRVR